MFSNHNGVRLALLAFIRRRRYVTLSCLLELFPHLCSHHEIDPTEFDESYLIVLINEINLEIKQDGFMIDSLRDQETDDTIYALVIETSDGLQGDVLQYPRAGMKWMIEIVDRIVNSPEYEYTVAIDRSLYASGSRNLESECRHLISRLVTDCILRRTDQGKLVISSQGLMTLSSFLVKKYGVYSASNTLGKLLVCANCDKLVTLGMKCREPECPISFHLGCYNESNDMPCPTERCTQLLKDCMKVGTSLTSAP